MTAGHAQRVAPVILGLSLVSILYFQYFQSEGSETDETAWSYAGTEGLSPSEANELAHRGGKLYVKMFPPPPRAPQDAAARRSRPPNPLLYTPDYNLRIVQSNWSVFVNQPDWAPHATVHDRSRMYNSTIMRQSAFAYRRQLEGLGPIPKTLHMTWKRKLDIGDTIMTENAMLDGE